MVEQKNIITEALKAYGFGAAIEVTNGMKNRYHEKAEQALKAKSYLEELTGRDVCVSAGLAYIRSNAAPDYSSKLNFLVNVQRYNPIRLEKVLGKTLETTLTEEENKMVVNILLRHNKDSPIQDYISGAQQDIQKHSREFGISAAEYRQLLTNIKGVVMELYI